MDPTEIGPNCCWANQFAQFVGWGGISLQESFARSDPGLTALTGMFICSFACSEATFSMGSFTEFPTLPQKHRYSDSKSSIQARYFYRYHISTDINLLSRSVRGGGDVICVLRSLPTCLSIWPTNITNTPRRSLSLCWLL